MTRQSGRSILPVTSQHDAQVHPDAAFRDKGSWMTQKAAAVLTALSLNRDLSKALSALDLSKTDDYAILRDTPAPKISSRQRP
jgi:hypothetical protein